MNGTLIWCSAPEKTQCPTQPLTRSSACRTCGWARRWSRLLKLCFRPSTAWPQAKLQAPMRSPQTWRGTARLPYCFLCIVPQDFRDAKIITLNNNGNNWKGISFLIIAGKDLLRSSWSAYRSWSSVWEWRTSSVMSRCIIGYRPSVQILLLYEIEWRINPGWR